MNYLSWCALVTLLIPAGTGFADERSISSGDGVFLLEWNAQLPTNDMPRLYIAIWQDGFAVRNVAPAEDRPKYASYKLSRPAMIRLKQGIIADGILSYDGPLLRYEVPDASSFELRIQFDGQLAQMRSCIDQFEQQNRVVAIAAGIVPREGQTKLEILSNESQEFIFQRMIWAESMRAVERPLVGAGTGRLNGSLRRKEGNWVFEYQDNPN